MRGGANTLSTLALAVFVGIAIGYGITTVRVDDPRDSGSGSLAPDRMAIASSAEEGARSREFAALQRELESERRARESAVRQLEALRKQPATAGDGAASRDSEASSKAGGRSGSSSAAAGSGQRPLAAQKPAQPWFDRTVLQQADYSSSEIDEIVQRFEELEMQKLYLEDKARRDGTFRSAGYNRKLMNLNRELREDLGVGGYDAYLYATGRDNRVEVREVLADSPASYAGLEPGDIVISYSGLRVFHPREFKNATAAGEPGARVTLEVQRDGELYRLSVARGPLGIRMGQVKKEPLRRW